MNKNDVKNIHNIMANHILNVADYFGSDKKRFESFTGETLAFVEQYFTIYSIIEREMAQDYSKPPINCDHTLHDDMFYTKYIYSPFHSICKDLSPEFKAAIKFNKDGSVKFIQFEYYFPDLKSFLVKYDCFFNLIAVNRKCLMRGRTQAISENLHVFEKNYIDIYDIHHFKDECFFLKMFLRKRTDEIEELLPEFYFPAAYDFNNTSLKERIELVDILSY